MTKSTTPILFPTKEELINLRQQTIDHVVESDAAWLEGEKDRIATLMRERASNSMHHPKLTISLNSCLRRRNMLLSWLNTTELKYTVSSDDDVIINMNFLPQIPDQTPKLTKTNDKNEKNDNTPNIFAPCLGVGGPIDFCIPMIQANHQEVIFDREIFKPVTSDNCNDPRHNERSSTAKKDDFGEWNSMDKTWHHDYVEYFKRRFGQAVQQYESICVAFDLHAIVHDANAKRMSFLSGFLESFGFEFVKQRSNVDMYFHIFFTVNDKFVERAKNFISCYEIKN